MFSSDLQKRNITIIFLIGDSCLTLNNVYIFGMNIYLPSLSLISPVHYYNDGRLLIE